MLVRADELRNGDVIEYEEEIHVVHFVSSEGMSSDITVGGATICTSREDRILVLDRLER